MELEILFLIIGFLLGGTIVYAVLATKRIKKSDISRNYVSRELHEQLQNQADVLREDFMEKGQELKQVNQKAAAQAQQIVFLEQQMDEQKKQLHQLNEQFSYEFQRIADKLLEEKSKKFVQHNENQLNTLLNPLKQKIKEFEEHIDKRLWEEAKDRISLKKEVENLRDLNVQLSTDANNLVSALKGENKIQGDWGEMRLEMVLEKAGLLKDVHYKKQLSLLDAQKRHKRPDFIIHLPDQKHLIVDSKVSLKAFEEYHNTEDEADRRRLLRQHLDSIRRHIKDLQSKNYQKLHQINSPDYLLLYIPLEPAYALAIQHDNGLYSEALENNILLVNASSLLATMRTVAFLWKQERQSKNVQEIVRQSGFLYDKFCNFVEDLQLIGQRLDQAQETYQAAMNKLVNSKKYGDTLVGRVERLRQLGAGNTKQLPIDLD